ncbi:M23 family metallopeptidase [Geomonas sp. RF6]|uniref:M23 family metallopeptidase n=1 Tax=Geomonas sp. RF6 TaxID=2897342 RepID=UPI001E4DDCC7|nr:M23 family metallopeptidase [Geomonas sp. RF6]UFS70299.1 M23 family metallopeptidase [Geomonas sp. RF6]
MKLSAFFLFIIIAALAVGGFFYFQDTTAPYVALSRESGPLSAKGEMTVRAGDRGSGLKSLTVSVIQGEKPVTVLSKSYPKGTANATEKLDLTPAALKQGPFKLQVSATDHSIFNFGSGNSNSKVHTYEFDNKPPAVVVLSTAHNIARGGVGLAIYTVSKEVSKTGVAFDNRFFPAYRQPGGYYACLFPFPFDADETKYIPKILAVDLAGNQRLTGIYFHLLPKVFPADRINLTDAYLDHVNGQFQDQFPQAKTPLEVFLKVNRELRVADAKKLQETGLKTSPTPLWKDVFLRMPNSAPRGAYAQRRTYIYQGKEVDQQTHLGTDLAALAHAQIPAANSGKVAYADYLGIYGQCVIIDHGMGLQSLYGHLSAISVKAGDVVQKGQIIGNTGDTGLAGGDHLHFGMLVSGEQVNPVEWWDPSWIRNNISSKLEAADAMSKTK